MLIALASMTLLCGGVSAMQAKQAIHTNPSLTNSTVDPSIQQNNKEPLRLAKDQRCRINSETGVVRCSTNS